MHVLLASHRYHPVPGGTERVVQTIAEALLAKGHRATVLTQQEPGVPDRESYHGVEVIRLRMRHAGGVRFPQEYLRTLRRLDADVFHLHGNRIWCADFYFPWARFFRWPQLLTGHGFYQYAMHPRRRDRWYFERYFPWALRGFDRYTPDTMFERQQLIGFGVAEGRLRNVALGVPLDEFAGRPAESDEIRRRWGVTKPHLALYAGGFFENKRVDRLIEGIARVKERWSLVALGRDIESSPYNLARCRSQAESLGVELRTPGVVSRGEVVAALYDADAVVLGSEYEGFGLLPVEAMAAGTPFVAWPAGAAGELAATGAGILAPDAEAFARALTSLEEPGHRAEMGRIGRSAVAYYSESAMVDRYLALYQEILAS
ncbi:MAG: glycosyltransferase family 4 protein [Thermoplasmata archaeon]|nr:glycosyltransferase family 4 protein [Thermoplasmata archaeon]